MYCTITKAGHTFESSAWATYDMAYRSQATNRGSLDAALYSEACAGRAKMIPRCRYCLADTHTSPECPHAPAETAMESRQSRGPTLARQPNRSPSALSVELCRLYNAPGGPRCRFTQVLLRTRCRCPHSASECGGEKHQRTHSPPTIQPPASSLS